MHILFLILQRKLNCTDNYIQKKKVFVVYMLKYVKITIIS